MCCWRAARGEDLALLQHRDATAGEIETAVARMRNQAELLELLARHALGMNEVAHIDQVRLEQLVERPRRVSSELERSNRPLLEGREGVGNEPLRPQLLIDLAKGRLPFVEVHELQFGLNRYGAFQFFAAMDEDGELSALRCSSARGRSSGPLYQRPCTRRLSARLPPNRCWPRCMSLQSRSTQILPPMSRQRRQKAKSSDR
jgi:hypothetical protein